MTFQHAFRPARSVEEGKRYFGGKHQLYGFKVEVSVTPNGFAVGSSMHEPGSVFDLVIFQKMQWSHSCTQRKKSDEMDMKDSVPLAERYPNQWAMLADNGYQSAGDLCRSIHLKSKPQGSFLSPADVSTNKFISSDRILVEKWTFTRALECVRVEMEVV